MPQEALFGVFSHERVHFVCPGARPLPLPGGLAIRAFCGSMVPQFLLFLILLCSFHGFFRSTSCSLKGKS